MTVITFHPKSGQVIAVEMVAGSYHVAVKRSEDDHLTGTTAVFTRNEFAEFLTFCGDLMRWSDER